MLAQGGATEGITLEQLQAGPVRLKVPDPDVAFVRQVEELAPFPPQSLPAALEATAAFIPTRRAEFYKEEDRFLELGEAVPTYKPPHDDEVHDPAEYPIALLSPHSKWRIHSSYANVAWLNEITGGRAPVLLHPSHRGERGIDEGDLVELRNTRGARPRLGAPDARRPARHRHPLRGLVEPAARRRQERQRAHLVRGEPHPRDPLRGQHVGAVHRMEGLPLRGHEGRRRHRRGDRRGGRGRFRRRAGGDPWLTRSRPIEALPPASRAYGELEHAVRQPRWGMVVDQERCIGCWSCCVICKSENDVPLGMWWNRIDTVGDALDTPREVNGELEMHWLPLACQHCENPACTKVCPVQATYPREDGVVMQDPQRCIGCRFCMVACPYGVRTFNWGKPDRPDGLRHRDGAAAARRHHGEVHLLRPPARRRAGALVRVVLPGAGAHLRRPERP